MSTDQQVTPSDEPQAVSDLELLFQDAPIGLCVFDTDLRYVRINETLAAINGKSISEHLGRDFREILPEIAPSLESDFRQLLETGKPILNVEVNGRVPSAPDSQRHWICNYYPLVSREGGVRGLACTVQEITERKLADEARQSLLDAISQANSAFVQGDDPHTLFAGLLSALLSLTASEYGFIGEILRTPDDDPYMKAHAITNIAWDEKTRTLYDTKADSGLEFYRLDTLLGAVMTSGETVISNDPPNDPRGAGIPEGHPALHAFIGLPLRLGNRLVGMIGLANRPGGYDEKTAEYLNPLLGTCGHLISAYRNEQTRKEADVELKRKEAELQQAQRLESLGMLVGGIAHDFSNMLTPILAYTGLLLEDTPADDDRRGDLREIQRAGEEARDLIHELLAFSREQMLELETVRLGDVVIGYEKTIRRLIRKNIELEYDIMGEEAYIEADTPRLGRVLLNLAVNAQDAMPDGGVLSIQVDEVVLEGDQGGKGTGTRAGIYVVLSVRDNGFGMDEDVASRIFDPFYSTKERGHGVGLGLATVHGIVRQHEGWIDVRSAPGKGTTFDLYFPRSNKPIKGTAVDEKGELVVGGGETVLVVEDEEMVRKLMCTILKANGYTVIEAEDGEDALVRLKEHGGPIDLLLTDVVMPKMGGRELFRHLRDADPSLKVLFVSGYTDGLMTQEDLSEPGIAFLAKPFSAKSVPQMVRDVLDDDG